MAALFHQGGHAEIHGIAARRHHLPRKEEIDSVHKSLSPFRLRPPFCIVCAEKGGFALNCGKTKRPDRGAPLTDPIQYGLPRLRDKALCLY
ncbi:MAG TPA: hypothetical protein DEP43_04755 [Ruminococcaceae bacterium]|nr:hypothetical protein [Oscillospiraceae bacterium]